MQCKSILVVEDDDSIRNILKLALELEGYDVRTAANGKDGVEIIFTMPKPCLILLDLMMPVMDGWGFVDVLGRDVMLATIPVVLVTAYAEKAKTIGRASGVIKKPVDLDLLLETVRRYCDDLL